MVFCSERCRNIPGYFDAVPALVIQYDTVASCTHTAIDAERGSGIFCQSAVVPVKACRSNARRRTSGSSLPRAEALRRIPRQAF